MRQFSFSLQKLLDVRTALEEAAQRRLANALRALMVAREEMARLALVIKNESERMEKIGGKKTDSSELLAFVRYRHALEQMRRRQGEVVAKLDADARLLRRKLNDAIKEKKSLELLKAREYRVWIESLRRAEQKETDEIASQRFIRRSRESSYEVAGGVHERAVR